MTTATTALDEFALVARPRSATRRVWTESDGPMPALYLGHGAPPLLDDSRWMGQLFDWAMTLPKPTSIVIVSAHWENAPIAISATAAATPLVYDFWGFEQRFYDLTYPTPDATDAGRQVAALLPDTMQLHEHTDRGLDHGAWVPLLVMYPNGDVPVVQLSMPSDDPLTLVDLGQRLRPLREQGVLVIGSGFLTHGLRYLRREDYTGELPPPTWSSEFDQWAAQALAAGDIDTLAAFRTEAPGMPYAHPTAEHYLPLFVTLGLAAGSDIAVQTTIDGYAFGLSKRSFQVP